MATMAPRHLARWSNHGQHKPPFKAGTPEYARWWAQVKTEYRQSNSPLPWPEYYAQMKAVAANRPVPSITMHSQKPKLFGGALTREYRAWYYRVQQACKALPPEQQNWPVFFASARKAEELRQGLIPSNIVRLNPAPARTTPVDERLMFDFSVDPAHEHHTVREDEQRSTA